MSNKPNPSPLSQRIQVLNDFLWLVLISFGLGMGLNQLRAKPLPFLYQTPAERLANTVVGSERSDGHPPSSFQDGLWRTSRPTLQAIDGISLDELKNLLGKPEALILDARPDLFYEVGHIPSALNLSKKDFEHDFNRLLPRLKDSKVKQFIVYCSDTDCDDSKIVAQALARLGFGPVRIFKGGWEVWEAAGLKAER